jgi:integrase/recombinase XerD
VTKRSQARAVSSIKALYRFLDAEGQLPENPCDKLSTPKLNPYLPTVLSVEEVMAILDSVDLSQPEGHRNRCILEVLYSCGLRVSELVGLKISDLFLDEQFIRVFGKGSKQRLVPIGEPAAQSIRLYRQVRDTGPVQKEAEDILFLNHRGGKLSRVAVFNIVKEQAAAAGIRKEISPHTFRHSFATHLVENGADLRVVQQMLGHESILTTEIYTHIDSRKWQDTILKYHPIP